MLNPRVGLIGFVVGLIHLLLARCWKLRIIDDFRCVHKCLFGLVSNGDFGYVPWISLCSLVWIWNYLVKMVW
jgi:hypothetical protein